jgi:hypothetical protein
MFACRTPLGLLSWELWSEVWESVIQRYRKGCLDPDGNMKSKNKGGRAGRGLSIACNAARYASAKRRVENLNEQLSNSWLGETLFKLVDG